MASLLTTIILPLLLPYLSHLSLVTFPQCSCYLTSSPSSDLTYFTHHQFFDFCSILSRLLPSSIPNLITVPSQKSNPTKSADLTSSCFETGGWTGNWALQNFGDIDQRTGARYGQVASPGNLWVGSHCDGREGTCLVLRSSRENEGFQSVVEMDNSVGDMWRSSVRVRMRIVPTQEFSEAAGGSDDGSGNRDGGGDRSPVEAGAVLGFFTYGSDTSDSDIEILTRDPTRGIRCSNQPDYDESTGESVAGASTKMNLPEGKKWTQWIDYRFDWLEGVSRWWMDGEVVLNKRANMPRPPGGLILNLWSDGGEWSGEMRMGGEVGVEVQRVEMVYNVNSSRHEGKMMKRKEDMCKFGCWVDGEDVTEVGVPVLAFDSINGGMGLTGGLARVEGRGSLAGQAVTVLMVYLLFGW